MLAQVVLGELSDLDQAVYGAIARTPTPELDRVMARISDAANYSRLSLAAAAALAVTRGDKGRHAAALGLASVAVTAAVVNLAIKPLGHRRRPDRSLHSVPGRQAGQDAEVYFASIGPYGGCVRVRERR